MCSIIDTADRVETSRASKADTEIEILANKTELINPFGVQPLCYKVMSEISYSWVFSECRI